MAENFVELNYKTDDPIQAKMVAESIIAVSRRYRSFLHQRSEFLGHFEEDIHISGVRSGSQIFEFVPIAIQAALPFIADANTVISFQTHLKEILEYFDRKAKPPQKIVPKVCDDAIKILQPATISTGGMQLNAVNGNITVNNYYINPSDADRILNHALQEKLNLEMPDIKIIKAVKFKFIQSRTGDAKTVGYNSPDKGIIPTIDTKVYSVLFDEKIEHFKYDMMSGTENFFAKDYIVDAEIIEVSGRIRAYKSLSIKEV